MAKTRFSGPVQSDGGFIGPGGTTITGNSPIDDLEMTASVTYDDEQIQDIADKVDEILAVLRTAGIIQASSS